MAVRKDSIQITMDIDASEGVKSYQRLLDPARRLNSEMRKLRRQGKENTEEYKKLEKQAAALNKEFRKFDIATATKGQLIARAKMLNREMIGLVKGTKRYAATAGELKKINTRLKKINQDTHGVAKGMDEISIMGMQLPPMFQKVARGIQVAVKAFFALQVVQFFVDWANQINETTKEYQKLRGQIQQTTDAAGDQLDTYTVQLSAISKTFNVENQEIINAATALTKQLTGDFGESLRLIEQGFLAGANRGGDFLDQVKEYPTFFREAGLSGEQMIATITQGVQEGVFSDKGVDLIKEFTLRVREMTPATEKALNSIGITSEKVGKMIQEEGIGGAFQLVQDRLKEIGDAAPETGAVLADVFGGPGEDAGLQFVENLQLANITMEDLTDSGNEYLQVLRENYEANEELAEAQNRLTKATSSFSTSVGTSFTRLKSFFLNVTADVFEFFQQLPATAQGVQAAFKSIINNIINFFDRARVTIQITLKRIEKLNPFGKTSEQLDQEIKGLERRRLGMKEGIEGVMKSYREAYLSGLAEIEKDQAIAEAFMKPPPQKVIEDNARDTVNAYRKAVEKEIKAPSEDVDEMSIGDEDVADQVVETRFASQEELLRNQFLKQLMTEQEYEDRRYELLMQNYERRLEMLRQLHGEESAQFVTLENEKLEAQKQYEQQRAELTKRTEEFRWKTLDASIGQISGYVDDMISLLSEEEQARKKNSLAIKAFQAGKVIVAGISEVQQIWEGAAAFGPLQYAIAIAQTAAATARTGSALGKIRSASFYSGGYTGNQVLLPDAYGGIVGGVHKNEWVAPEWMTTDQKYAPIIGWLESMRQNGYRDGGFAGVESGAAAAVNNATPGMLNSQRIEELMENVRDTNMEVVKAINKKQFSVVSGQIVDVLAEEARLDRNSSF